MHAPARRAALLGGALLTWALAGALPSLAADGEASAFPSTPAGTYLAARAADRAADFGEAAGFYALALAEDPDDPALLEATLGSELALGRLDEALPLAERLIAGGTRSPMAHMVVQLSHARAGDWRGLLGDLEAGRTVGPLMDGLTRAWAWMGQGETEAGLSAFDELAANPAFKPFALYHKALALAVAGDLAGAEAILSRPEAEGLQDTRRAAMARAQVLGALGRPADARALLDERFGQETDATLSALRASLEGEAAVPFALVTTPSEGLSEAYFNLGALLGPEEARTALLYARASLLLDPRRAEAALLAADRLEALGQFDLAREAYALVPSDSPLFVAAELGRASILQGEGESLAALEVLNGLAEDQPDLPEVQAARADLLRAMSRFPEAEAAYTRAIALRNADDPSLWWLHFARGLSREAQDDWAGTEADLRRSLELKPDSPQVLNHLGYSLVERGENLSEALGMIAQAVALRPDSGAIVDSLGWAYFKLGRFDEAVTELETAASLLPSDPVVNDHLGDAYWTVGRQREARFQWRRALSLEPEPELARQIRDKLDQGLDAGAASATDAALAVRAQGAPGG